MGSIGDLTEIHTPLHPPDLAALNDLILNENLENYDNMKLFVIWLVETCVEDYDYYQLL